MSEENSATNRVPWWEKLTRQHQLFIVFISSFLLYANTLTHNFTIDDAIVITQNDFTKKGISGIPDLFRYDTFRGFFKVEGKDKLVAGGRYRPLTLAMFAVEYQIFGYNPMGSHLVSILCFALLCVLVFLSLERMLTSSKMKSGMLPFVITMLFAFHPIHTEVVANIKGRDEIMSMLLGTASLYFLIDEKNKYRVVLSALMMFLAMLAKEMAATFVPIAGLIYLVLRKENFLNATKATWPLLVGMLPYLIIRQSILGFGEVVYGNMEMMNNPFVKFQKAGYVLMESGEKVASIIFCLGYYVKLLFIPHPLSHDYYPRAIGLPVMGDWEVLVSLLIYGGLIYSFFKFYRKKRLLSFGIGYFIISLILVSNILFPIGTHMGERFLFMGSLGFCIALGRLVWKADKRQDTRISIILVVLALFAFKTVTRNAVWESDFKLFQTDVLISEGSAKVNQAAGGSLVDRCLQNGGEYCNEENMRKALLYLERAVKIHPAYRTAYLLKGNAHYLLGENEPAIASFRQYQKYSSTPQTVNSNLVKAFMAAAKSIGEDGGDVKKAMRYLDEAEKIEPQNPELLRLKGVAYGVQGQFQKSIEYFEKLLVLDPNNPEVLRSIGMGYMNQGQKVLGQEYFDKATAASQNTAPAPPSE